MAGDLVQILASTLSMGMLYALIAVGVTLIYSATGIINFAQGEFMMLSGMTVVVLHGQEGWPLFAAAACAMLVVLLYSVIIMAISTRFGRPGPMATVLIITIGASIATSGIVGLLLGTDTYRFAGFSGDTPMFVIGVGILPQALWVVGIGIVAILALELLLTRTPMGKAMRAAAMDTEAVALMGITPWKPVLLAFLLSGALGGLAGIVGTPLTTVDNSAGILLALKGFSAAMLGSMGSIPGALFGALLIALLEAMAATWGSSALKEMSTFAVIFIILLVMPRGLFGGFGQFGGGGRVDAEH